jgi:tRNA A37 methylthiotransferase MiaB
LAAVPGVSRVRVSYLQPAEMRPGLIRAMTGTAGVVPYFDLSFQHASPGVLRRMRRFGGTEDFLALVDSVRAAAPDAGIRSNVIVGFPGESEDDLAELEDFLTRARLDVVGVFGYSDEEGTEAATLDGKVDPDEIALRVSRVGSLVEELVAQRAEDRVGELVEVLVEGAADLEDDPEEDDPAGATGDGGVLRGPVAAGRAAHQGPEVDGVTRVRGVPPTPGLLVRARVVASDGPDLVAQALPGATI